MLRLPVVREELDRIMKRHRALARLDEEGHEKIGPWWGDLTWRDAFILMVVLVGVIAFTAWAGAHGIHPDLPRCDPYVLC